VTAPLFLLPAGSLDPVAAGDVVIVDGEEGRHAVQVRRLAAGERVDLADGAGQRAEAVVVEARGRGAGSELSVRVVSRRVEPAPDVRFVLVQALAKGDRDVAAVEAATELGVDEVVPWQAERSVVIWRGERAAKHEQRWANVARAAAKQSRHSRVPVVGSVVTTAELRPRLRASALVLVLHEDAEHPLAGVELPEHGDVLLLVGPEGGIGAEELDRLTEAGAVPVRLGPGVLRSSTAGPAALAVLSAATRWR
jgi:16S rRNA (uracil1498-N3)-methyltransferase